MFHVIITSRSIFLILFSIVQMLLLVLAILSPAWLVGVHKTKQTNTTSLTLQPNSTQWSVLGFYRRCDNVTDLGQVLHFDDCIFLALDGLSYWEYKNLPNLWLFALIFFSVGLVLMVISVFAAVTTFCIQSLVRKVTFVVLGTIQSVAGFFYVIGLIFYSAGWNANAVTYVCGPTNRSFWLGECTLGWSFYLAVGATFIAFLCSALSLAAGLSTYIDRVQQKLMKGKCFVTVL